MIISFAEATRRLLSGKPLTWDKFGQHKGGSVALSAPGQRRLFAYLLAQDPRKVAQGDEELFSGLIAAWQNDSADPASEGAKQKQEVESDVWRLQRIEASNFLVA